LCLGLPLAREQGSRHAEEQQQEEQEEQEEQAEQEHLATP
jgi:hypothetical protein